jgi:DNA-binding NarL/FixJ family response regulator
VDASARRRANGGKGDEMTKQIDILIVDDHEVVRHGLREFLQASPDFEVVGDAKNGEVAVELTAQHIPDVVLMDLVMPGMDGVETTRQVKNISPRSQVVVLTSYHEDEHIFPALKAGAISYVLKDIAMEDLADAIRQAAAGEAVIHPRVAARVVKEMRGRAKDLNPFTELTDREIEVLRLIADGLTNHKIADQLFISENTVKGHVSNILSKLQLADRTQAAVFAWKEGIARRD